MTHNLFITAGYKPSGLRAKNINTIDEVPDSNWFTNRIGTTTITIDQIARGPIVGAPPDPSKWMLIREKTAGVHPGFTARDAKGETWFLEFDPPFYPGGRDRSRFRRDEDLLGAGLQPGGIVPDDVRSDESGYRPESHGQAPVRGTDAIHAGRHERRPRKRRAERGWNVSRRRRPACFPARSSGVTNMQAHALTTPTTLSRTSIVGSSGRCACSARGRT